MGLGVISTIAKGWLAGVSLSHWSLLQQLEIGTVIAVDAVAVDQPLGQHTKWSVQMGEGT